MIRFYILIITVLAIAAALFLSPVGSMFGRGPAPAASIHTVARQYLESAQMISLHCKYTDVFELSEENLKNIWGLPIPQTGKHVIIKAEGTVFLGIDCRGITTDTARVDTLFMTFPPIKKIAHECEFTAVHDLSGVFRKYSVKDVQELRNSYKSSMEFHTVNDRAAISQAEAAMEKAFRGIFWDIQALKDIPIVIKWGKVSAPNISLDIKRETPASLNWEVSEN